MVSTIILIIIKVLKEYFKMPFPLTFLSIVFRPPTHVIIFPFLCVIILKRIERAWCEAALTLSLCGVPKLQSVGADRSQIVIEHTYESNSCACLLLLCELLEHNAKTTMVTVTGWVPGRPALRWRLEVSTQEVYEGATSQSTPDKGKRRNECGQRDRTGCHAVLTKPSVSPMQSSKAEMTLTVLLTGARSPAVYSQCLSVIGLRPPYKGDMTLSP